MVMDMIRSDAIARHTVPLDVPGRKPGTKLTIQLAAGGRPDVLVLTGIGNEGRSNRRTVDLLRRLGIDNVAVAAAKPYWLAPPTMDGLCLLAREGALAAARFVRETYGVQTLHIIGDSQAAPAAVYAALADPGLLQGRVGLLHPLGLIKIAKPQFVRRLVGGIAQPGQFADWRSYPVGIRAAWRSLEDHWQGGNLMDQALGIDITTEVRQLAKTRRVGVFAASHDKIYPVETMRAGARELGLAKDFHVVPGSHSSPSSKAGVRQLAAAIAWCRSGS